MQRMPRKNWKGKKMIKVKEIFKKKKKTEEKKISSRVVTQANLEESREEVLAKGKKFRYPFQYAKHRLMINAIIIGLVAVLAFTFVGWMQLYKMNSTGDVAYRFTLVIPLSVAEVDGKKVRFSDYLMLYRSSVASIERQQGKFDDSDDSKSQLEYYRRQALNLAEDYSYAMALLAERGISVTNEEIDEVVNSHRMIEGELRSEESFAAVVNENFGLSMAEYRRLLELSLAKKKISVEIDTEAKELADEVYEVAQNNEKMSAVMELYASSNKVSYETTNSAVGRDNLDGGRAEKAFELEKVGDISEPFVSVNGDGYYIVKLTAKADDTVSYESIFVRFTMFDEMMQQLRDDGKVSEKINVNSEIQVEDEEIIEETIEE